MTCKMLSGLVKTDSFVWTMSLGSSALEDMSPVKYLNDRW